MLFVNNLRSAKRVSSSRAQRDHPCNLEQTAAFVRGILVQESYLRNSCFQALQVIPSNDYSLHLIAIRSYRYGLVRRTCHDDDEQNAHLLIICGKYNGLEVSIVYCPSLACDSIESVLPPLTRVTHWLRMYVQALRQISTL